MRKIIKRIREKIDEVLHNKAGFTLIELVMVIVILGILGAVAIPRFMDLSSNAETASAKGVEGALASTAAIQFANAAVTTGTAQYPTCTNLVAQTSSSGITLTCSGTPPNFTLAATINSKTCHWTYSSSTGVVAFSNDCA